MAKTLEDIITDTRQIIGQPDPSNSNFTDTQLTTWINDAYRRIVMKLGNLPFKKRDYTASTEEVTLNASTVEIRVAKFLMGDTSKWSPLVIITLRELLAINADWENEAAGDPVYLVRTEGYDDILLHPPLKTSNQGSTLRIYALEMPTDLSASSDTMDLPENLHDLPSHWAASRALQFLERNQEAGIQITMFRSGLKDQLSLSRNTGWEQNQFRWEEREGGDGRQGTFRG